MHDTTGYRPSDGLRARDHYVGVMKAVSAGICPEATLIDITHDIRRTGRSAAHSSWSRPGGISPGDGHRRRRRSRCRHRAAGDRGRGGEYFVRRS